MGLDHHAERSIAGGGLEGDMAVSRYVRAVCGACFSGGVQADDLGSAMVHHHAGAECDRVCDGVWRYREYPDGRYSSDLVLPVGYFGVGLFLELFERNF